MAQYENNGDRLNILLADELPEDMTGTQDTKHICGKCAWYSFAKLDSICRKTGKEVAYFANRECFTTDKDMDMEENNNAQPVAESTGTQVCKECGRTLPLDDFQRRRNGNVDNVCKACRAEKARIGIARKKALKVENPALVVTHEEEANAKRVEIAQLSRYLRDFKMAGIALWGMMPGKEEDIDQVIKAEWAIPFCREIFAAAADLSCNCATKIVPSLVARRLGGVGRMFVEDLGDAFYGLAKECDTEEQTSKEKPSVEDVLEKAGVKPYKDGNKWCILAGDNLQEGICGFGDTIEDALCEFLTDVFNTQKEQKHAECSEEDKAFLKVAIAVCNRYSHKDIADWLQSLPERFNLQPKEEWSEEDEEMLNSCISSIEESKENRYAYRENDGDTSYDREIAWLKSLRSRPKSSDNLKPSEEQPARVPDISDATLLDELRRRGYKGRVSKCEEVEI